MALSDSNPLLRDYLLLAQKAKTERRFIFNHLCIRVESLDDATQMLSDSFNLAPFESPGGETFEGEREYRVSWLEGMMLISNSQSSTPNSKLATTRVQANRLGI